MTSKKICGIITIMLFLFGGCATLQDLIDEPTVTFEKVKLKNVSLFESTPVFTFNVKNPNPMGLIVSNIDYNLTINEKKFIKGMSDQSVKLSPAGSNSVDLPITFNHLDLFDSIVELMNTDKVNYDLSGSVTVGPFLLPYQTKGILDIPQFPSIHFKKIDISNLSLSKASLLASFDLENRNPFSIKITGLDCNIKLGDTDIIHSVTQYVPQISKNGKTTVEMPIELSFKDMGQALYRLLMQSSSKYELTGNMTFNVPKIGEKQFPFQNSGNVSVKR